MTYEIIFSKSSLKQLKKLERKTQKRILNSLDRIRLKPERYIRKLADDPGYRLRVCEYRIILDIHKNTLIILVMKIGHRRSI